MQVGVVFDQNVGDDNISALPSECERILATQAARGARDDRNPSREIEHVLSPQFDGGSLAGKSARDDKPLNLRAPLPDLVDLRVSAPLLDRAFLDLAISARDLH